MDAPAESPERQYERCRKCVGCGPDYCHAEHYAMSKTQPMIIKYPEEKS